MLVSPENRSEVTKLFFSKTSLQDCENLCSMDCSGIEENQAKSDDIVYDKFLKQLEHNLEGCYETNLIWKEIHSLLRDNKYRGIARLNNLVENLRGTNKLGLYDSIIQEQRADEIIENNEVEVNETVSESVFYLPHSPVIRETAKIRIVYNISAKACQNSTSLNKCLETGPPLRNRLCNITVRSTFRPTLIYNDTEKSFLQIRIRESHSDALRFHWV